MSRTDREPLDHGTDEDKRPSALVRWGVTLVLLLLLGLAVVLFDRLFNWLFG